MPISEVLRNIDDRIAETPKIRKQVIKKIGNKMKNAAGAPLEYFKPDESGCLSKDALAAGFKAMKVILGESLMQNL